VGAMKAGAKGVTFGRNIFQHQNPPAIVNALYKVIVRGISRKEVLRELAKYKKERSYN
jgi:fructose-bisphosphate aldolase / 2-amino-3,7-dideoxy-D-threo-hept-6-ulosonate synthase